MLVSCTRLITEKDLKMTKINKDKQLASLNAGDGSVDERPNSRRK